LSSAPVSAAGLTFLHAPGPTHIPSAVMSAMNAQLFDLNDPRLTHLIDTCELGLRQLMNTKSADVMMYAANGHGAWEATIVNLIPPNAVVLVAGSGHFSEMWAQHVEGCGRRVIRTAVRAGLPIDADDVEAALRQDSTHQIAAVFAVHTDAASGVTSDMQRVREAIDRAGHPALFVVDAVASLGTTAYRMDHWRVNVTIGSCQKGLMVPPGLSFVAVDKEAVSISNNNPEPRVYWDWRTRQSTVSTRRFGGTPPVGLLMGLRAALAHIEAEGYEEVFKRHMRIARAVQAAVGRWSDGGAMDFMVRQPAARSTAVTVVGLREGIASAELCTVARERFHVALGGGVGPQRDRSFRIGHLGAINEAMMLGCLASLEAAFCALHIPIGKGALDLALASLNASTVAEDFD
jgi:alanine-glyoxylate transaminase / serine-glyoxylate transaminase / serine-pyruvate transaminase